MSRSALTRRALLWAVTLACASVFAAPRASLADPPPVRLTLQNTDGSSTSYLLSEIQRLSLDETDLMVVLRSGSSSSYPFAALRSLQTDAAVVSVDPAPVLASFEAVRLLQNQPNPASRGTRISFDLSRRGRVSLDLYEISGRRIRTLADKDFAAGRHAIDWDGTDARGRRVSAGVYFYRLKGIGADQSRRLVVLP